MFPFLPYRNRVCLHINIAQVFWVLPGQDIPSWGPSINMALPRKAWLGSPEALAMGCYCPLRTHGASRNHQEVAAEKNGDYRTPLWSRNHNQARGAQGPGIPTSLVQLSATPGSALNSRAPCLTALPRPVPAWPLVQLGAASFGSHWLLGFAPL